MKGYKIKYHLAEHDITISDLAKDLDVTPQTISKVISGKTKSKRIAIAISNAINKPLLKTFPAYQRVA